MTDAALLGMLKAHAALGACAELTERLAAGLVHGVGVGETTARDAAAIFRVRQVTAREAQLSVSGLDQAVAALAGLGDQHVTWRHYRSECELFTVFVVDAMVVGCLRVTIRARATGREDGGGTQEPELSSAAALVQQMAIRELGSAIDRREADALLRGVLLEPRHLWRAMQIGLVTPAEITDAVAAHVHQWMMDRSGRSWAQPLPVSWDDFIAALALALFPPR